MAGKRHFGGCTGGKLPPRVDLYAICILRRAKSYKKFRHGPARLLVVMPFMKMPLLATIRTSRTTSKYQQREPTMKTEQLLDEIREANLTYLLLAQQMIRQDKAQALFRLGIGEHVADIVANLSTGQVLKIAGTNMLMCQFRFDDQVVWNLLTSHSADRSRDMMTGVRAAMLMSEHLDEAA
jgi:flagellar transcriptional activator FlhD